MKYFIEVLNKINLISISYADSIEDTPVDFSTTTNNNVSSIASLIGFIVTFLLITGILLFLFMVISKKNKLEQLPSDFEDVNNRISYLKLVKSIVGSYKNVANNLVSTNYHGEKDYFQRKYDNSKIEIDDKLINGEIKFIFSYEQMDSQWSPFEYNKSYSFEESKYYKVKHWGTFLYEKELNYSNKKIYSSDLTETNFFESRESEECKCSIEIDNNVLYYSQDSNIHVEIEKK